MQANNQIAPSRVNHADVDKVIQAIVHKLRPPIGITFDYFAYSMLIDVGASTTAQGQFLVQNDSAFAITNTAYVATDQSDAAIAELQPFGSGLTTGITDVIVSLTDTGSGRQLSDARIPIDTLFGTAQRPFFWPRPKLLPPASTFQASVQNLLAVAMTLRLTFHGYKIFGQGLQGLSVG